jgi:hypothetical protein
MRFEQTDEPGGDVVGVGDEGFSLVEDRVWGMPT